MASIRRTDIMHNKGFSKGRPAKSERERNRRRQEAYRWRDARRIYLANSFDRWRKLRCSLGMKDSALAWHLMEAHENGQCGICRREIDEKDAVTSEEPQAFHTSLVKAVKKICYSKFQFEECIKIVGLLCLEFDNCRKENFSVNEIVPAKSRKHPVEPNVSSGIANISSDSRPSETVSSDSTGLESFPPIKESCAAIDLKAENENLSSESENCEVIKAESDKHHSSEEYDQTQIQTEPLLPEVNSNERQTATDSQNQNESQTSRSQDCDSFVESEAEVSLEIDVEKVDTSQEMEESFSRHQRFESSKSEISSEGLEVVKKCSPPEATDSPPEVKYSQEMTSYPDTNKFSGQAQDPAVEQHYACSNPPNTDLPLDMSVEKPNSNREKDETKQVHVHQETEFYEKLSVDTSYPQEKMELQGGFTCAEQTSTIAKKTSSTPVKSPRSTKDEAHPSIPWQRRDMSRKEEYEFLELNPFSDLSEFSQRYPHVHQRTYYRWKRRIKEEYIILEQCPHMSFEQFSGVVLQAKESVFNLWKSFIAQGKGFFAPSDVSKRLEAKCQASKAVNTLSEQYSFLQKNLSCTQEQFCQHFSNTSAEVFIALKRKVLQEFWVFHHNQHLDWKEFSKLVDVSEEVHKIWRDHVSRDLKSAMSCFSPNSQIGSTQYSFQNASDPQGQPPKPNPSTFDSALEESVSRSLSASYLTSVQNMMFPWASYYGVHNSLNHQMLPMMLWPRMMGLNGNASIPMTLPSFMASSPSSCESKADSPEDMNSSSMHSTFESQQINAAESKSDKGKVHPQSKEMDAGCSLGGKRSSSMIGNDTVTASESDFCKKQKFKEDPENVTSQSPMSKSRKQNKQEYIYYLKNPSLSFKDLATLFPTISLRTFYRWRKEMNAALLFIQEKRNPDYQQFKPVFPDIPEEIFEIWKAKSGKENFAETFSFVDKEQRQNENFEFSPKVDETKETLALNEGKLENSYDKNKLEDCSLFESTSDKSLWKDAHIFVHQNPNVDIESFSKMFPHVSAHMFYQWKKDWKNGVEFLQAKPDVCLDDYKSCDSSVTGEIFEIWKKYINQVDSQTKAALESRVPSEKFKESRSVEEYSMRKLNSAEFTYLQLHPRIEFSDFHKMYAHVSEETFDQWRREVQKIINYISCQPSVSFEEISAVLPDVTEEAFLTWKEIIASERNAMLEIEKVQENGKKVDISALKDNNEDVKAKMTNALLQLMHDPNVAYQDFYERFPFVSTETFELWLHRIKAVILHISSNPTLNFEEFRSAITDIGEDIFLKWKSLTPEEISAIGKQTPLASVTVKAKSSSNESNESYRAKALYFCQENPAVTYESFSSQFPNISQTDFKCWMLKISTQISFIRDNKDLIYEDFRGIYPDVERVIFDSWKISYSKKLPNFLEPFEEDVSTSSGRNSTVLHCITNGEACTSTSQSMKNEKSFDPAYLCTNQKNLNYKQCVQEHESSLKKLAKLAESDPSYCSWSSRHIAESQIHATDKLSNDLSSHVTNPPFKQGFEFNQSNNSSENEYRNNFLTSESSTIHTQGTDNTVPVPERLLEVNENMRDIDGSNFEENKNQSLSALMVMSADNQKPPLSLAPKAEKNPDLSAQLFSGKWKCPPAINSKEDEEMFSSQRQKKMSRAEYLFVKDNPDVDSQEFARIFPGVSARTFYRWKKEIKAQMQIA